MSACQAASSGSRHLKRSLGLVEVGHGCANLIKCSRRADGSVLEVEEMVAVADACGAVGDNDHGQTTLELGECVDDTAFGRLIEV